MKLKEVIMKDFIIDNFLWIFGGIFLITLFVSIASGVSSSHSKRETLKNNCKLTNLYVIGDKGHVKQVYKCKD